MISLQVGEYRTQHRLARQVIAVCGSFGISDFHGWYRSIRLRREQPGH